MASAYLFAMLAVTPSESREVALIANPEFEAGRVAGHRGRRLIDGGNSAFSDPFLVMAENWVPRDAFSRHPHRGIETVTLVLDGALEHCAGIVLGAKTVGREFAAHSLDLFGRVIEINLIGTFNCIAKFATRAATLAPLGEERGVIINIASVAADDGRIGQAAFAASKSGGIGLTLPVARDLSQYGIRVMTVAPGIFWTPMISSLHPAAQESLGKQVPFPSRLGKPEEYALLVQSILANPMLNGETIRLDGAIRMAPR
jgi:NAD(P)-dependent dehydrogenase (short-subunit alcohol dehydrogenase family)